MKSKKNPLIKNFLYSGKSIFLVPSLKNFLYLRREFWKVWKNKQEKLHKVVSYDTFSIFMSTEICYKPCFDGSIRINRSPSFLYNALDRIDNQNIKRSPSFVYNFLDRNKLLEHFTAIFGILNDIFGKNREFWKDLEPIRALQANRMGIRIFAFPSESYILKKRL